jgi:gluconate 5-dehydrogenase
MSTHLFDLSDKVALITGSTDGLGNAIARGLGQAGATIIVNGRSSQAKLDDVVDDFRKKGINAFGYLCDVVDEQQVMEMIDWIEEKVGPLNILVNNAGVNVRSELINMSAVDFRRNVDVNLLGPFLVSKYAIRSMIRRRSGKIINICSMMSELGRDTVGAYAAAKGGLKMLTRNMATEWARHNIQVNGIGPGYFATRLTAPLRADGNPLNDFIIYRTPAGRWGQPEELVGAAVFLSSSASSFVNGHILYVDGGILATIGKPSEE